MKHLVSALLILSLLINLFLYLRKSQRTEQNLQRLELQFCKNISFQEGFAEFEQQWERQFAPTNPNVQRYIVLRWDSNSYAYSAKAQLLALDSIAALHSKTNCAFIAVTEMEQGASEAFLRTNGDVFPHLQKMYGQHNFISGLHQHPKVLTSLQQHLPKQFRHKQSHAASLFKQSSLYAVVDRNAEVLYSNSLLSFQADTSLFSILNSNKLVKSTQP